MKRRLHAYCISPPKSGTTSMAGIFSSDYRVEHGPYDAELIAIILALKNGRISPEDFRKYVIYLDNKGQLEFNSSFLNAWQLDILMDEFPDAKFILTIRDCYSWLNSFIHLLLFENSRILNGHKKFLNVLLEEGGYQYAKEELFLHENGVYPLDYLLSYWVKANNEALAIAPSRILVIKTHEIGSQMNKIANFLNIPPKTLDSTKSYMNRSIKYPNILSNLDRDYLFSRVNLHCKAHMDKFFPGFIYTFE